MRSFIEKSSKINVESFGGSYKSIHKNPCWKPKKFMLEALEVVIKNILKILVKIILKNEPS